MFLFNESRSIVQQNRVLYAIQRFATKLHLSYLLHRRGLLIYQAIVCLASTGTVKKHCVSRSRSKRRINSIVL